MQRPASVTTFGIINIVFAAWGLFGLLGTLALLKLAGTANNPIVKLMRESPPYAAWMKLSIPLGLIGAVVLLVAGIGLLLLKPWARKLTIGYAIYGILLGL